MTYTEALELFKEEIEEFKVLIRHIEPDATDRMIDNYITRWFYSKKDIIEFFGNKLKITATPSDFNFETENSFNIKDSLKEVLTPNVRYIHLSKIEIIDVAFLSYPIRRNVPFDNLSVNNKAYTLLHEHIKEDTPHPDCLCNDSLHSCCSISICPNKDNIFTFTGHGLKLNIVNLLSKLYDNNLLDIDKNLVFGMKVAKFFKMLVPNSYICDQLINDWSMFLQERKSKGGTVVASVAPTDYLLMSESSYFDSCCRITHNEDDSGGEYMASILSYMCDECTIIGYKPTDGTRTAYCHTPYTHQDKEWRTLVYLDIDNKSALFTRNYPRMIQSYFLTLRYMIMYRLAELNGVEPRWSNLRTDCNSVSRYCNSDDNSYIYADWRYEANDDKPHGLRCKLKHPLAKDPHLIVSSSVECLVCGDEVADNNRVVCNCCYDDNYDECYWCERRIPSGDTHELEGYDTCLSCFENRGSTCFVCEETRHHDYLFSSYVYEDALGDTYEEYICTDCDSEYARCHDCNCLVIDSDEKYVKIDEYKTMVCPSCYEDYDSCLNCSVKSDALTDCLCDSCYEEEESHAC